MNTIVRYDERGNQKNNKYMENSNKKLLIDLHKLYKIDEASDYVSGYFSTP